MIISEPEHVANSQDVKAKDNKPGSASFFLKMLLAGTVALIFLGILETGIRLYISTPQSDWAYKMRSMHRRFQVSSYDHVLNLYYPKNTVVTQKVLMAPHPQKLDQHGRPIQFEGAPVKIKRYKTCSQGFRNPEFSVDKGDRYRIVCVGDSCTWGDGVLLEETYPMVLEKKLNAKGGENYQVINAGAQGLSSLIALYAVKNRIADLKPDVLVLSLCVNDEIPQELCDTDYLALVLRRAAVVRFLDQFYVYLLLKQRLRATGLLDPIGNRRLIGPTPGKDTGRLQENTEPTEKKTGQSHQEDNVNRVAITQKLKNTQTLITFCRERNIALIIMTPPLTSFGARHLVGPPVEAVARLAVSQNVPVIDLFTIFPDLERENGLTLESEGNRQKLVKNTNGEAQVLIETERSPEYQISPDIFRFIYRHNLKQTTVIDQLHPTPKGHEIIATLIHKKLLEMKVLR